MIDKPTYLGDSVYVQPWPDAPGGVILTTGSHKLNDSSVVIFLEPEVLQLLIKLCQTLPQSS